MNKIYKTVWSAKKGTYVAVSEIVTNRGKEAGGSEEASTSKPSGRLKTLASILLSIGFVSGLATQAVAQDVTTGNIDTLGGSIADFLGTGALYNSESFKFVVPTDIGGTGKDTVFGAIGKVQGDLTSLTGRVTITESGISTLTGIVGSASSGLVQSVNTNTSSIEDLQTAVGAPTDGTDPATGLFKDVADLNANLTATNKAHTDFVEYLGVDTDKAYNGIKYFRVNSDKTDANAVGVDSIAIGPVAVAQGDNSTAIGHNASITGGAKADGSIALGNEATIVADVDDEESDAIGAIAIGKQATSSATAAIALGQTAAASGGSSVAIGNVAEASGDNGIALGNGAKAIANENISIGYQAGVGTVNETANDQFQNIAIGSKAGQEVLGYGNVALGYSAGSNVSGNNNIAFGSKAGRGLTNDDNISIGRDSNSIDNGWRVIAIGAESSALETGSLALGYRSSASDTLAVALGTGSVATEAGSVALGGLSSAENGHIAIGSYSSVTAADAAGLGEFSFGAAQGAVSVGTPGRTVINANDETYQTGQINRRIVNVADGKNDSDAATVAQLKAVAAGIPAISYDDLAAHVSESLKNTIENNQNHYVSINDGDTQKDNYFNTGADKHGSIAIGPSAFAYAENATVVGSELAAISTAQNAVLMGTSINTEGKNSVTIGNTNSITHHESGIAIGTSVTSRGENSIVIGRDSEVDFQGVEGETIQNSIVIGTDSKSTAEEGIVIGRDSRVNSVRGIAQGSNAHATAEDATAIGTRSRAQSERSQAFGTDATAQSTNGIAVGYNAQTGQSQNQSQQLNAIAIGTESVARNNSSTALGTSSEATANYAMALGNNSLASAINSTAIGREAEATAQNSLAFGDNSTASATNSSAIGTSSEATASSAIAFGHEAKSYGVNSTAIGQGATVEATAQNAVALGAGATAAQSGNVALGAGSVTQDVNLGTYYINDNTSGFSVAGKTGQGTNTVSVGTAGNERQIQHVAPGVVSATSTDAINGSQLHATNLHAINLGTDTAAIFGGSTTLQPDGHLGNPNFSFSHDTPGAQYQTVQDAMSRLQTLGMNFVGDVAGSSVHRDLGQTLNIKGGATGAVTDNNISVVVNGSDTLNIKLAQNVDLTEEGSVLTGIANNGGSLVQGSLLNNDGLAVVDKGSSTNVGAGSITVVGGGNTIAINGSSGDITGLTNKTLTAPDFAAVGRAATEEQLAIVNETANKGWNLAATGVADSENIAPGETATFAAGKNMTVSRNGATITYATADTVVFDNVTVGDTIINKDSGITTNQVVINHNGDEINVGEELSKGITFSADSGTATEQKLGGALKIAGDNNITTEVTDGEVQVALNKNVDLGADGSVTTGNALLNTDGLTVAGISPNDPKTSVTAGKIELSANPTTGPANTIVIDAEAGTIAGLTNTIFDPEATYTGGLAATQEQLSQVNSELTSAGLNFAGNTGDTIHKDLGDTLNIVGGLDAAAGASDANIRVDSIDGVLRIQLATKLTDLEDIQVGKDGVDGIIGVNGKDGASVVLNGADGSIGLTGPRGADGSDGVSTNISVKDGAPGLDGKPGTTTTRIVYTDENNNPQEVANLNDGLKFVGDDGQVVSRKLNETLGLVGGADTDALTDNNIGVVAEVDADGNPTGNMEIKLAQNIDLGADGSVIAGGTKIGSDGLTFVDAAGELIENSPSITSTGISGGNNQITNVASGLGEVKWPDVTEDMPEWTNAANIGDLVTVRNELVTTGLSFDANTGGVQTAALGSIVAVKGAEANTEWDDFDAGENIMTQIVKDEDTGNNVIRVALAKDITGIETIILGENGAPGKDGADGAPGIGLDGKDGVIGITGKDGIAGADGIDGMPGASADITVKQGAPGIDGNDGVDGESKTRIVYEKPDGTVEEVATLNDGLYFQGDQADDGGNVARKLNETLNLSGGESDATKLAVGANIGIIKNEAGDGYDFLLAKDLRGLNTIQIGGDTGAPVILGGNAEGSLVLNPDGAPAKITNVAPGAINSDSTDAINGSQLQAMGDSLTQFFGEGMEFTDGSFNWDNYFTNIFGEGSDITNLAQALEPWNAGTGGGNSAPVLPGDNVDISPVAPGSGSGGAGGGTGVGGSGNIVVNLEHDGTDHNYTLDLADNIHVNQSITVGNTDGSYISMGDDGNAGSAGSLNFYGEPDADGNRVSASQTVVAGPGGVGTDQSANDGTRLQYTDGEGNAHTLATLGDGLSFGANDGVQHDAALNTRVDIVGAATNTDWSKFDAGQNIMTQVTTNEDGTGRVTVALSNDLKVESVTATTVQATTVNATTVNATTVNADSVAINNGGPVINNEGINMNDNRITNVAPGVDGSDAVNVDQLVNVGNHLQNQINDNRHQIRRDRNRANAGIAAAMATAGLPQAYLPGKSMVAVAGGVWRGESGVAIGVSTVSENGKWILKGSANTSGRGGAGGTIGAGYQW